MPRFKLSDPVLRLERVIFRRLFYEGHCPKLSKRLVDEGRQLGYAYEQLLSGEILQPDGTPRLDLLERHEAYVERLVEASRWRRRLGDSRLRLPRFAWRDFALLVQVGGVPFEIAEMIKRYRSGSDHAALDAQEQQLQRRVARDKKLARQLATAEAAMRDYSSQMRGPAKNRADDLAERLKREAMLLQRLAQLARSKPSRNPELRFCLDLWQHMAITSTSYQDDIISLLLDELSPLPDGASRRPEMMARRRALHRGAIEPPGSWVKELWPPQQASSRPSTSRSRPSTRARGQDRTAGVH